jgi:hypothetical protein
MDEDAEREQPEGEEWGVARVVENREEAILIAGFLQSSGIPAEVESLHVDELPFNVGALGEIRVRVPAERLEEALAVLDLREDGAPLAELSDLAESEPEPGPPPAAGPPNDPSRR